MHSCQLSSEQVFSFHICFIDLFLYNYWQVALGEIIFESFTERWILIDILKFFVSGLKTGLKVYNVFPEKGNYTKLQLKGLYDSLGLAQLYRDTLQN